MEHDEPRLFQRGVELLTRFLDPIETEDGKTYVALPHGLEAVMAVACAGLGLATLAGTEHGIPGTQDAMRWGLQQAGLQAARGEDFDSEGPPVLVDRQRSSTVRDVIHQLRFAASQLPTGLDTPFKVAMCHGSGKDGYISADVEIDTWGTLGPQRQDEKRCVVIQGHPHREPEGSKTTLKPFVPDDLSGEDLDLE